MGKQVLLIKGSPRKNGNTSVMADAFGNGAKESGNTVTEVFLKEKISETVSDVLSVRETVETASRKMT